MRLVVQRVMEASVVVSGTAVASISKGLLLLLGITHTDTEEDIDWLVKKISQLRIFEDASGQMNASLQEVQGELILVSQFTLFAATKKGNRPSYIKAAKPEVAEPLYEAFGEAMEKALGKKIGCGACISLNLCPLLSQGQIEALEHHANADLQALYLPKLISGEWTGTMNLTEPHAGSDVGALSSKAEPQADGSYKISGQKIFITWGEHDVAENICHLVLARLPGAKPGPKGISLFLVPKFIPHADGSLGARNDLRCVSLEHKLGIHGSPTAVMEFSGATGWLVGEEHNGMACMFTMMNNARLAVGMQGVGVAEGAYQHALAYAMDRKQGRAPIADGTGTIIDHADVRRMLAQMKADIFAARSIGVACAIAIDMAKATGDTDWQARAALLTPIAKSFGSDTGVAVADLGVQIHGGMGFVEETAAAQYLRDARITPIYEGTNGIQSMDLVARKMMDGGAAAFALMDDMEALASASNSDLAKAVLAAIAQLRATTQWVVSQELNERFAGSVAYQKAFARVLGGYFHLVASMSGQAKRQRLARVYINSLLPEAASLCAQAQAGAADLYALELDDFAA